MKDEPEVRILVPNTMTRRELFQLAGSGLAAVAMPGVAQAQAKTQRLNLFTYLAWANADILAHYKKTVGIEVKPTVYSTADEMLAKLAGGGTKLYDMCVPVQYAVRPAIEAGVIEALDKRSVPNAKDVFPGILDSAHWELDGKFYGAPFVWGANAMAYDRKATGDIDSLSELFNPKWKGRIGMPDDGQESLAIGALRLGVKKPYQMDDRTLEEVKKLLISQKPLVRTYWKNYAECANLLSSGEVAVTWARLAIVNIARKTGADVGWVWPKEGALGWNEAVSAVKGTANKAAVEAFADWTLSAEFGKLLGELTGYTTSSRVAVAKMDRALIQRLGFDITKLNRLVPSELPADKARWNEVWNEVKNA